MSAAAGHFDFEQGKDGRWRLYEYEKSDQLMQWYHQGSGRRRRVRHPHDGTALPSFKTRSEGVRYLQSERWGRWILGEGK
jgi:hypothetical protein